MHLNMGYAVEDNQPKKTHHGQVRLGSNGSNSQSIIFPAGLVRVFCVCSHVYHKSLPGREVKYAMPPCKHRARKQSLAACTKRIGFLNHSSVVEGVTAFEAERPGFKSCLYLLLAV